MPWDARRATGHAGMDRQHREIVVLIDRLGDEPSGAATGALLGELVERLLAHFAYEEELMRRYPYPAAGEHRDDHAAIAGWAVRLRDGAVDAAALQSFLHHWAQHHMGSSDRRLAAFLAGRA